MSEPYIKVWAGDMRADAKIADLVETDPTAFYVLVQAWDLAKNSPVFGELRRPNGAAFTPETFADFVPGVSRARARSAWKLLTSGPVGHRLAEQAEDGALTFPALERRQGNRLNHHVSDELHAKRSAAGRAGAARRWGKQTDGKEDGNAPRQLAKAFAGKPLHASRASQSQSHSQEQQQQPKYQDVEEPAGETDHLAANPDELQRLTATLGLTGTTLDVATTAYQDAPAGTTELLDQIARRAASGDVRSPAAVVRSSLERGEHLDLERHHANGHRAPSDTDEHATRHERRQKRINQARRLYADAIASGDTPSTALDGLEETFRNDPTILDEAGIRQHAATPPELDDDDVPIP